MKRNSILAGLALTLTVAGCPQTENTEAPKPTAVADTTAKPADKKTEASPVPAPAEGAPAAAKADVPPPPAPTPAGAAAPAPAAK